MTALASRKPDFDDAAAADAVVRQCEGGGGAMRGYPLLRTPFAVMVKVLTPAERVGGD